MNDERGGSCPHQDRLPALVNGHLPAEEARMIARPIRSGSGAAGSSVVGAGTATTGAATGAGGEIRDEGATGLGARPKAGLVGYTVSNLRIPGFEQPWERGIGAPSRLSTTPPPLSDRSTGMN